MTSNNPPDKASPSRRPLKSERHDFRPIGWASHRKPREYIRHLYSELIRLEINEYQGLVPLHAEPIREIFIWEDEFPNTAYASLHDWRTYDLQRLVERGRTSTSRNGQSKPRIEIVPEITSKRNLSVRWYPAGFFEAVPDWLANGSEFTLNEIPNLNFSEPPDFTYFTKESFGWGARPANELILLRGVGGLHIDNSPFDNAPYGFANLEELLICTIRAIFNRIVDWCRVTNEVTVTTDFKFETYDEEKENSRNPGQTMTRVKSWKIAETDS